MSDRNGFVIAYAACLMCGQPFSFNPHKVPSFRVDGAKEPVCRLCIDIINVKRVANDLPPHVIEPDAYQAMPEGEL
jgi:hypothetical protein